MMLLFSYSACLPLKASYFHRPFYTPIFATIVIHWKFICNLQDFAFCFRKYVITYLMQSITMVTHMVMSLVIVFDCLYFKKKLLYLGFALCSQHFESIYITLSKHHQNYDFPESNL